MFREQYQTVLAVVMMVAMTGCGGTPAEVNVPPRLPATAPVQFPLTAPAFIARHPNPDSTSLEVVVQTGDSTPHISWTPALVTITTDRGYTGTHTLIPSSCLRRRDPTVPTLSAFPDVFVWESCALVSAVTERPLEPAALVRLAASVDGQLYSSRTNKILSGAVYTLRVAPGLASTEEALRRLGAFPGVAAVYREGAEPPCVFRDPPRPSCPPWQLVARVPFTYGAPRPGEIPVASGGRVRAVYVDSLGRSSTAELFMP